MSIYEITYRYRTENGGGGIDTAYADTRAKTEKGINKACALALADHAAACGVLVSCLINISLFRG